MIIQKHIHSDSQLFELACVGLNHAAELNLNRGTDQNQVPGRRESDSASIKIYFATSSHL